MEGGAEPRLGEVQCGPSGHGGMKGMYTLLPHPHLGSTLKTEQGSEELLWGGHWAGSEDGDHQDQCFADHQS